MSLIKKDEVEFQHDLQPILQQVETFRQDQVVQIQRAQKWYYIPVTLLATAGALWWQGYALIWTILSGVAALFSVAVLHFGMIEPIKKKYLDQYRRQIQKRIVEGGATHWNYRSGKYMPRHYWKEAALYGDYNSYQGEDYIEGRTKHQHIFRASELLVCSQDPRYDNGQTKTVFKGWFVVLELGQSGKRFVQLTPPAVPEHCNAEVQLLARRKKYKAIALQYPTTFTVYTDTRYQEEGRAILTPKLLSYLDDLRKRYRYRSEGMRVSIVDNHLYCALPMNANFFQVPDLYHSLTDPKFVDTLYKEYTFVWALIEELSEAASDL